MRPRSSFPYLSNYFSIFSDALRLCQKKFSNSGNKCPKKFSPLFYGFLFLKFLVLVVCHSVAARLVSTSRFLDFSTILSFSFLVSISRLVSCLEIQDKMGFLWHKIVENYDFQKNLEKHFTI